MNGDAKFSGSGNSVAALLGNSNGNLAADERWLNQPESDGNCGVKSCNYLVGQIFGDDEVRVNCAAANLDIVNGVARPQILL